MIVGVPKEVKDLEYRVSTTPAGAAEFVARGHEVLVERAAGAGSGFSDEEYFAAGAGSGFSDEEYFAAGATLIESHGEVFAKASLIIKVKEPTPAEYELLRSGQVLFTFLHLAADEPLTLALMKQRVQAVAYETVQ